MVRPVSLQGLQGVSLRGFRGLQIFLWALCVCIKYLSLGDIEYRSGGIFFCMDICCNKKSRGRNDLGCFINRGDQ